MSRGKAALENPLELHLLKIDGDRLNEPLQKALRGIFPTIEDVKLDQAQNNPYGETSNKSGETKRELKKRVAQLKQEKRIEFLKENKVSKKDVVIGFNNCLKLAQKGEMDMIFVDPENTPKILQTFLLPLCKTQSIDIIGLENLKTQSTSYFGFHVNIFGFTKSCRQDDHAFSDLIGFVSYLIKSEVGSIMVESQKMDSKNNDQGDKNLKIVSKYLKTKKARIEEAPRHSKSQKAGNFHLKRTSSDSRVFIPKTKCTNVEAGKDFGSDFIVFS